MKPRVVYIAPWMRSVRRYHLTPSCKRLTAALATLERGPHGVLRAGFRLCNDCAWHVLHRSVPRCRRPHSESGKKCQLTEGHKSAHYARLGYGPEGESLRWR